MLLMTLLVFAMIEGSATVMLVLVGITGDNSDLSAGFSDDGAGILHAALISL